MPEAEHDPMAPVHTSARKRSLPQEFVAPDPGPAVVISAPASVRATSQRGAISAHAASKAASHRGEVEVASVDMVDISMRGPSGISLERSRSGDDKTSRDAQPLKQTSFSKVKAGSTISHRTPLAPVTGQRSLHQQAASAAEKGASQIYASASVSLTSKVPFKPSSGLTVKSQSKATPTSDTRSLLAALHALKRPA